jgi:hypothetical protein
MTREINHQTQKDPYRTSIRWGSLFRPIPQENPEKGPPGRMPVARLLLSLPSLNLIPLPVLGPPLRQELTSAQLGLDSAGLWALSMPCGLVEAQSER